jgi:hypothetical protein
MFCRTREYGVVNPWGWQEVDFILECRAEGLRSRGANCDLLSEANAARLLDRFGPPPREGVTGRIARQRLSDLFGSRRVA